MHPEHAGRYRILGRIKSGGMGEVYAATMETFEGVGKAVAIKLVRKDLAKESDFSALFVEEAKVAMSLSHANVVQSFDVGRIDDRWFLAMEFVEGIDLAGLLDKCHRHLRQPIPHRHVIFIAVEALKGLDYAHRRRGADGHSLHIVHRDVSPGNLLISNEGEVKVADFGIAKSALRSVGSIAGTIKGKVPYMAPEQLRGAAVDRRADLYSVGAVLYEMLTGQRIVDDELGTMALPQALAGDYPKPRELNPSIPEELERIVLKALAMDQSERYQNAASMRQDLEQLAMDAGYLLSANDLADFVEEVLSRQEPAPDVLGEAGPAPARAPAARASVDPSEGANPFDALLGAELRKVQTGEPFSVFTSGEQGRRLATAALPDEPRSTTPETPRAARDAHTAGGMAAAAVRSADDGPRFSAPRPCAAEPVTEPVELPRKGYGLWVAAALAGLVMVGIAAAIGLGGDEDSAGVVASAPAAGAARSADPVAPAPQADAGPAAPRGAIPPAVERSPARSPDAGSRIAATAPSEHPPRVERGRRDAGPPRAPTPAAQDTQPAAPAQPGRLSVNTDPWSYVYLDGNRLGPTPQIGQPVPAGRHRLRLHNPSEGLERTVVIDVEPGEHERVSLDLRTGS